MLPAPHMEIGFPLSLSAKQRQRPCSGPPYHLHTRIWVRTVIGPLIKSWSICQSGWREIRNAFLTNQLSGSIGMVAHGWKLEFTSHEGLAPRHPGHPPPLSDILVKSIIRFIWKSFDWLFCWIVGVSHNSSISGFWHMRLYVSSGGYDNTIHSSGEDCAAKQL